MLRIAVVGAGVSGLRCADILIQAGAHVTLFEARNRVGGRVHQVENGGHVVDAGSNWIHGTKTNPIMEIAKKTGTAVFDPDDESAIFDENGERKSDTDAALLSEIFWAQLSEATRYSKQHSNSIDPGLSLFDWLKEQFEKRFGSEPSLIADLLRASRMYGQFVGIPITRQSLRFFWLEEGLEGGNVFVASTYKKILDAIAEPVLDTADVQLNTEVVHISYRLPGDRKTPVKIALSDKTQHEFDEVVVTCPLGWLKKHNSHVFSPDLPGRLTQAISNVGYGALEKLYVSFPSAFWLREGSKDTYPWVTDFFSPAYHPDPAAAKSETWNQGVVSLAHFTTSTEQPTLLFYMHGDCGAYLTNKVSSHVPHSDVYDALLKAFSEPFYSRLPNYRKSSPECSPTSFYLTTWQTDPFAGYGSYSCFPTGLENGDDNIVIMRNAGGLSDAGRGLWLAGEHTAPFEATGTTTGAYWSGEAVGRRILKSYGLSNTGTDPESMDPSTVTTRTSQSAMNGYA